FGSSIDINHLVECNNRSKRRDRIRFIRLDVSLAKRRTNCSTARVRVFDDAAGGRFEFLRQIPGRFQINDVVVRKFFALKLSCGSYSKRRLSSPSVERSTLMRIFAIPQALDLFESHEDVGR